MSKHSEVLIIVSYQYTFNTHLSVDTTSASIIERFNDIVDVINDVAVAHVCVEHGSCRESLMENVAHVWACVHEDEVGVWQPQSNCSEC